MPFNIGTARGNSSSFFVKAEMTLDGSLLVLANHSFRKQDKSFRIYHKQSRYLQGAFVKEAACGYVQFLIIFES